MLVFAIELCLCGVCAAFAYIYPELGQSWLAPIERRFCRLANRRAWAVVLVGLLALAVRLALLPVLPIPVPEIHDEYSHLLLADTLAHGRLANPTHQMWMHFETFHVNWQPTYASMYYPGFALFLAFGQVLLHHPFWGVWLSSGLMCAAICWALQSWVPPTWALFGGLLAVLRLGTFSYWVDSYWGGTVTALGGALVIGALPRIKQNFRVRDSLLMALGMALLASTRPYEGIFFCAPVVASLIWWATRQNSPALRVSLARVALPATLVMALTAAALGYYFRSVTGSPFTIPYQLNMRSYGLVYFPWQKVTAPEFHHAMMHEMYRGPVMMNIYNDARHAPFKLQFLKVLVIWMFYFGIILSVPLGIWLALQIRRGFWKSCTPEFRFLLLVSLATYLSIGLTIYVGQPHYIAPLTAVFYAMIVITLRDLWSWRPAGRSAGKFLVRSVGVICLSLCPMVVTLSATGLNQPSWIRTWCSRDAENLRRARIQKQLESLPGKHLVLVRYQPNHDFILDEWVFNNADIDGSKVLWARDMGDEKNIELLRFFADRRSWLIEPDLEALKLEPYPAQVIRAAR